MKELLIKLNACDPAKIWAEGKTWKEIYNTCDRGDWLLWLFYKTMQHDSEVDFKLLVEAKAKCANTVRHLMKDARSTNAIDVCFAFVAGNASRQDLKNAAAAAYAAYADAARKENKQLTTNIVREVIPIYKWRVQIDLI